jgi:DNA-binding response OmpR family regulator
MSSPNPHVIPLPDAAEERTVRFPSQRGGPAASPAPGDEFTQDLEIINILLLDDDADLADTLKLLLESRNFVVTTARNGVEGLREAMAMDFDVIICDMLMPTMPGDMFYLAVQKVKPHLCSRFLFVTGNGEDPRTNDFLQRADGLVVFKPVPSDELLQMISLVLQRNARLHG